MTFKEIKARPGFQTARKVTGRLHRGYDVDTVVWLNEKPHLRKFSAKVICEAEDQYGRWAVVRFVANYRGSHDQMWVLQRNEIATWHRVWIADQPRA